MQHWAPRPATPHVTTIIPSFNYGRFIAQTLESIIAQTLDVWECVVVDDGSTGITADVVGSYARRDRRIMYVRQTTPACRQLATTAS